MRNLTQAQKSYTAKWTERQEEQKRKEREEEERRLAEEEARRLFEELEAKRLAEEEEERKRKEVWRLWLKSWIISIGSSPRTRMVH